MKAVEHKKEREVKYTDRVPPPKRSRTGCTGFIYIFIPPYSSTHDALFHTGNTSVPAKTLFQKTRSDASKLQKNIYNARILPPMPTSKNYGQVAPQMMAIEPSSSSRVTVNTVIKRRPTSSAPLILRSVSSSGTDLSTQSISRNSTTMPTTPQQPLKTASPISSISNLPASKLTTTASESPRNAKSPPTNKTIKKDPMAALFVPKRKAYSQRPV